MNEIEFTNVLNEFGLNAFKVNDHLYEVLNTDLEVNTDSLAKELRECYLITSDRLRYEKTNYVSYKIANVYYIVIGRQYLKESYELIDRCREKYSTATIEAFEDYEVETIPSIFDLSELSIFER